MSIEFRLPSIGEGIESADVAEILVAVGDTVAPEQIVMELETEKAVVELPCPLAGRVTSINVSRGDSVTVGAVLFTVEQTAEAEAAPPPASPPAPPARQEPSPKPAASSKTAPSKPVPSAAAPAPAAKTQAPASQPATGEASAARPAAATASGLIEFTLPNIGEGVAAADVAEILVKEGDRIDAGQVVMELETEKAVVELPSPHAGEIRTIHVAQGDTISVGQTLLTIEGALAATPPASSPPKAPKSTEQSPQSEAAAAAPRPSKEPPISAVATRTTSLVSANGRREETESGRRRSPAPAAPSTRRMARELGVDLHQVAGSGPGGRITHEDVQAYVRGRLQSGRLPAVSPDAALAAGSIAPPPLPDFTRFGPVERAPMNKIARTAAENLSVSWNVIPHVTQHDRADITAIEAARKRFGDGLGKNGPKVTMTAIVMKALATCLQAFPKFNSSLDPETNEIVLKRYYNIGCAVDTEHGLLVPVVRECDRKSILDIASELGDLAAKARERKLPIDAMQGATCTVTNLGGIGGVGFTPIVNYPEVCILGMSRGQSELKLVDGEVTERMMLPLSLSYDHRVINGADAARFVVTLCNMLSDPFQLLSAI